MQRSGSRVRDERGVVFPSPVVMLSIIAVAMAGIAFVATRGHDGGQREVTTVAQAERHQPEATATPEKKPADQRPAKPAAHEHHKAEHKKKKPSIQRGRVYVEVYNNSGITGLAGSVATRASNAGWNVVGSDNWYGTIPANTVYYPQRLKAEAKALALDLGISRLEPAVDPMRLDRLTVILTGALA